MKKNTLTPPHFLLKKISRHFLGIFRENHLNGSKETNIKNLMYLYFWGQDIHFSDFPEKEPKNADLLYSSENGAGFRLFFFQKLFLINPR